jgi:hypothetical protein
LIRAAALTLTFGVLVKIMNQQSKGGRPVAWSSMAHLLENLEQLADDHGEVYDTDVRERMWAVVNQILIKQSAPVDVPDDLGMFTPEANQRLKQILQFNLQRLREVFEIFGLDTEQKRLASFFNQRLQTERGHHVDDFFGAP